MNLDISLDVWREYLDCLGDDDELEERRHSYDLGRRSWTYNFLMELGDSIRTLDLTGMTGYVVGLVTVDDVECHTVVHVRSTSPAAVV